MKKDWFAGIVSLNLKGTREEGETYDVEENPRSEKITTYKKRKITTEKGISFEIETEEGRRNNPARERKEVIAYLLNKTVGGRNFNYYDVDKMDKEGIAISFKWKQRDEAIVDFNRELRKKAKQRKAEAVEKQIEKAKELHEREAKKTDNDEDTRDKERKIEWLKRAIEEAIQEKDEYQAFMDHVEQNSKTIATNKRETARYVNRLC